MPAPRSTFILTLAALGSDTAAFANPDAADRMPRTSVLVQDGKDRILGATIVAHNAGETIAEFVPAMKHGIGLNKLLGTIKAYPTMAEANEYAAGAWKTAHKPERLPGPARRYHDWRRG